MRRWTTITFGLLAGAVLFPATAGAATVGVSEANARATLQFTAGSGEANAVTVKLVSQDGDGNRYSVQDAGAPLAAGAGCSGGGPAGSTATCLVPRSRQGSFPSDFGLEVILSFALGDGDNSIDSVTLPAKDGGGGGFRLEVTSGGGVDTVQTGATSDSIDPGPGADNVSTGDEFDFVDAGAAADGADSYSLGPGIDALSYGLRTTPVAVDLSAATGGAAGESDSLIGVETVAGGSAADTLRGSDAESVHEVIYGGNGEDTLIGGSGPDALLAGPMLRGQQEVVYSDDDVVMRGGPGQDGLFGIGGDDVAKGGPGDDGMSLGDGDDRGSGGPGDDSIAGEEGADRLEGGAGRDRLDAATFMLLERDGAVDRLDCGPASKDRAVSVESKDRVRRCHKIRPAEKSPLTSGRTPPR